MADFREKARQILISSVCAALFFGAALDAGAQKKTSKKKQAEAKAKQDELANSAEPDKVLYTRALDDLKHNRYTEGRLALQTLINTYPDSEYLAKAKLAVADSYFKEGGTSNLTQAIAEYKDFETFFPFLDEAAYAQMQVGMCHFKMLEKPDRDTTQAQFAESELQAMLLKYPQSPLAPQAEQRLREVQEMLAEGQFRIARFYYTKQDTRAAAARLMELTDRYPLYSQSDEAMWMLADVYMKTRLATKEEELRKLWGIEAGKCYTRLVRDYPLSKRAPEAKTRLKAMGMAVPDPDPQASARMQKEQLYAKEHHSRHESLWKAPLGMLKSNPDVSMAAHGGQPNLNPPNDTFAATDVLKPQGGGPSFGISTSVGAGGEGGAGSSSGSTTHAAPANPAPSSGTTGPQVGVQIITPPATDQPPSSSAPPANPPAEAAGGSAAPAGTAESAPAQTAPPASAQNTDGASQDAPAQAAPSGQSNTQSGQKTTDSKDESTSKKKKGLRKIVPW